MASPIMGIKVSDYKKMRDENIELKALVKMLISALGRKGKDAWDFRII